jgi:hypothetical protein
VVRSAVPWGDRPADILNSDPIGAGIEILIDSYTDNFVAFTVRGSTFLNGAGWFTITDPSSFPKTQTPDGTIF